MSAKTEVENQDMTVQKNSRIPIMLASAAIFISMFLVAVDRLFLPGRFSINEVIVSGNAPDVDPAAVLSAVKEMGPTSWFSVDLEDVEQAVKQVPWVYEVDVRRKWPGKLIVNLTQAEPIALWNRTTWLNQSGEPLVMPALFSNEQLPRFFGPDDKQKLLLDTARMFKQHIPSHWNIDEVELTERGVWSTVMQINALEHSVVVRLGKKDLAKKLQRLMVAMEHIDPSDLSNISEFDLRYPNGFAARLKTPDNDGTIVGKIKNQEQQDG